MKKKLLGYAVIPVAGLSLLSASMASAAGLGFGGAAMVSADQISMRQQTMFQTEAQMLGISIDEVKSENIHVIIILTNRLQKLYYYLFI
jgi:hypothetical protein